MGLPRGETSIIFVYVVYGFIFTAATLYFLRAVFRPYLLLGQPLNLVPPHLAHTLENPAAYSGPLHDDPHSSYQPDHAHYPEDPSYADDAYRHARHTQPRPNIAPGT